MKWNPFKDLWCFLSHSETKFWTGFLVVVFAVMIVIMSLSYAVTDTDADVQDQTILDQAGAPQ